MKGMVDNMKQLKKEKGITLIALIATITIMLILISITIISGREIIKRANLENLKTNLLLVKAKAKEDVEQAAHELGISSAVNSERIQAAKNKLTIGTYQDTTDYGSSDEGNNVYFYSVSGNGLKDYGIDGVEGTVVIKYDIKNVDVEVYSSEGFVDDDGHKYFSLSDIQKIELN